MRHIWEGFVPSLELHPQTEARLALGLRAPSGAALDPPDRGFCRHGGFQWFLACVHHRARKGRIIKHGQYNEQWPTPTSQTVVSGQLGSGRRARARWSGQAKDEDNNPRVCPRSGLIEEEKVDTDNQIEPEPSKDNKPEISSEVSLSGDVSEANIESKTENRKGAQKSVH